MDKTIKKVKIIVVDNYLSFEHGLFSGMVCDATPNYTSTKKLKGYIVKSKKKYDSNIYMRVDEVEVLLFTQDKKENG